MPARSDASGGLLSSVLQQRHEGAGAQRNGAHRTIRTATTMLNVTSVHRQFIVTLCREAIILLLPYNERTLAKETKKNANSRSSERILAVCCKCSWPIEDTCLSGEIVPRYPDSSNSVVDVDVYAEPRDEAAALLACTKASLQSRGLVDLSAALRTALAWDHPNCLTLRETCWAFPSRYLIVSQLDSSGADGE
jgi:hypothetical protein